MEVLKISDTKLKIMLDKADMKRYGLEKDNIDYNDSQVRKSFWQILDTVKEKEGFDAEGDKLLIQYYPSADGGCELFVTKLGLLPTHTEKAITKSNRITLLRARRAIYRFDDLETLIGASRAIGKDSVKTSDVFYDECGDYYLEILERGSYRGSVISEYARLSEFAKSLPPTFYPYITEHCKRLTNGDAISIFSSF